MAMVLVPKQRFKRRRGAPQKFVRQVPRMRLPGGFRGVARIGGYYGRYAGGAGGARGGELKFFDTIKGQTSVAETGTILDDSLNHIMQGVTEDERVGRKCTIRSLTIHGNWRNSAVVGTDVKQGVRIICYLDKQANGQTILVADLLKDVTELNGYNSFYNLSNSGRFMVLMDKKFTFVPTGVGQTAAGTFTTYFQTRNWNFSKRCNIPVEFSATTGAMTEIRSNNIGILAIAQDADGAPLVSYTARVRFSDS